MNASNLKLFGLASLSAGLLALSGCDLNENADLENGRALFVTSCGTCHTLKEAATSATIGPNLDSAFAAARDSGMDQDTIEGVVTAQIENPRPTDPSDPSYMPAAILEGTEADDVATYVASVAGVPGIEAPTAPGGPGGQIFADNGCGACHTLAAAQSAGNVGPNLDNELPGQSEDMIRQSIVDPSAVIVQGFNDGIMPANYEQSIDTKDLDLLVKFLASSAGKGSSADAQPTG
ncbi:MAG: c-type cytochrome [Solirubrobacterales bacterium]|nr:c-type cytochrome [Solirubrobacterales bacterium]